MTCVTLKADIQTSYGQCSLQLSGLECNLTEENIQSCKDAAIKHFAAQKAIKAFYPYKSPDPDSDDAIALKIIKAAQVAQTNLTKVVTASGLAIKFC